MATNWNEILKNTSNLNDVLSILRKVLALLDSKTDSTEIEEALTEIQKLKQQMNQEFPESSFKVIENSVPRFSADCWTVDGVRSMSFCIVGDEEDAFEVHYTSRRKNDFAAAIFFSEDKYMHPYLSYETKKDFSNCTLSFIVDVEGDAPSILDEKLGLVMTVIVNDNSETGQSPYYLRLANLANPATLTATHAEITIDWNTVVSGYGQDVPFPKNNIDRIFLGCLTKGFDSSSTLPLAAQEHAKIKVSKIKTSGSNAKYIRKTLKIPQHTLGMCTGYDDSYNVNPKRIIKNCYDLGYRGFINHYCGMSHYYDQKWDETQQRFIVTKSTDAPAHNLLNKEAVEWHKSFAKNAYKHYLKAIFSVSYEMYSEAAEFSWTQRDWNDNYAYTGYEPPSYLLSPCNTDAMSWLQQVFVEFAKILHDAGHVPYMQVGEPWWWVNPDGKPCIYDYPTRLKFNAETGLYAPEIASRTTSSTGAVYDAYLKFLQKELGESVLAVRTAVKNSYPEAQVSTLFFLPSILGEGSGITATINYPVNHYKYPNLDFIQTETYDWLIVGEFNKALRGFTSAIDELGYPADLVHYLAGFVPDNFLGKLVNPNYDLNKDGPKVWQAIMGNAYIGKEYNVAKQYIWAYNQVMRDGLVIMPEDFLKKFWLKDKLYMSQTKEGEITGTPVANLPINPTRPNQPEDVPPAAGNPENPEIPENPEDICAGATDVASIRIATRIGLDPSVIEQIGPASTFTVEGNTYNFMDLMSGIGGLFEISNITTTYINVPEGYEVSEFAPQLRNVSDRKLRLKMDFSGNNENADIILTDSDDNPTYVQNADKRIIEVCLIPSTGAKACAVLGDCVSDVTIPTNIPREEMASRYTHYFLSWVQEENGVQTTVTAKKYWTNTERLMSGLFNSIIAMGGLSKLGESKNGETPEYSLFFMVDGNYIQGFDNTNTFENFYGCIKPENFRPMSITFIETPVSKMQELSNGEAYVDFYHYINSSVTIKTCGYQPVASILDEGTDYSLYPDL